MRIAVAGGTGTVGRHVVDVARERGHEVLVLTRAAGIDLTAEGPAAAAALATRLDGVEAVVDVTSTTAQRRAAAEAFFGGLTRGLLAGERAAGVGHHVALSIVGIDDVPTGYYAGKRLQERLLADGPVPWTVLRAAQFHEFAEQALGFARVGPLSLVPVMVSQPVAAREVAEVLVDAAEVGPGGRLPDLAGPEVLPMVDLARRVARARGLRRRVVPVRLPGAGGRGMRSGALTLRGGAGAGGTVGTITFDDWLGDRPAR